MIADCGLRIAGDRTRCWCPCSQSAIRNRPLVSLRSLSIRRRGSMPSGFPFDVPVVRSLETLELSPGVTFFVGENGSGKSRLLEAVALAAELPRVGSDETRGDATLGAHRARAKHVTECVASGV